MGCVKSEYIYCDRVRLTQELGVDLLRLANKWGYKDLEEYCVEFIGANLSLENVIEIAGIAGELKVEKLRDYIVEFVIRNMEKLKESGDLYRFEQEVIIEAIFRLKERNEGCKCVEQDCK